MPAIDEPPSAPFTATGGDELSYYKAQYEQLEAELADFQASSRELEAELEKDIEASEARERKLKEKVDSLRYEVEEWKTKYKQAKSEANSAQSTLQKEITTLREANRTLQLKLRDIEVANDDYERQARNTTSSLEDLESKYNVAIERGVLLEEEIRSGEQERESLRIVNQRLRDELADLKIEAEIVQEKLRHSETVAGRRKKPTPLTRTPSTPRTPDVARHSPKSSISSPVLSTPPASKFSRSVMTRTTTPPSPPISEASASMRKSIGATPGFPRQRASMADSHLNSRTLHVSKAAQRYTQSRTTSVSYSNNGRTTPQLPSRNNSTRLGNGNRDHEHPHKSKHPIKPEPGMPKSGSLYQIRGLIGKMQKLEQRVQSARSRLPGPTDTPPRTSPRSRAGSTMTTGESVVSNSVSSMRRTSRKRLSGSSFDFSVSVREGETTTSYTPHSRQSFSTRTQGDSRPSSRTSYSSRSSVSQSTHATISTPGRPESRQSTNSGAKTPLGHYSTNPTTESRRPRSSLSNHAGQHATTNGMDNIEEDEDCTPTPPMSVRKGGGGGGGGGGEVRRPSVTQFTHGLKKRSISGISAIPGPRTLRTSTGQGNMGPPPVTAAADRKPKLGDLGETY
ncbi:hypothetical protein ASPZODRAFT_54569 [Penicilliopsis zonata CBS 506.65]|uniref:NUDE domain-containing protein n=1 Tax=Penicilliopsis zonata CBS 506.65 TaxID=1073090 RepID=A0A1L9STZ2_9EURO|nr:hypothetical protein ASPZODRAFT_54569 [Penicilliopsis zonata CBS 506.65]OJJ50543.1 hypothetical protein ASPZODRAFT_54569 [Penicilliopsis zonata CBS 506.65]